MTTLRQSCVEAPTRVDAVDFWRGLVLCTIFVNHVPGNISERVTPKNFGFSDSSEAFVFLSGASLALAYAPRFKAGKASEALRSLGRRAVKLYGAHVALTLSAIAIFLLAAAASADTGLLQLHGRDLYVDDPKAAAIGLISLGHQLGYFNILPLYIPLLAFVPPFLLIGCYRPALMLVPSCALYLAARYWHLNVPTWPMKGTWFFDPFTWQLLMTVGLWAGLRLRNGRLPAPPVLVLPAAVLVLFAAVAVSNAFALEPGLYDWVRDRADLDKTLLGLGRLAHFCALAYLIHVLRLSDLIRNTMVFSPLCHLGRHSLWVFCVLSLAAAVGQAVTFSFGDSALIDTILIGCGLATMAATAYLLERRRALSSRPSLLPQPALASASRG